MLIRNFNTDEQVLVVAEIGNNHEGDASVAAEMIRCAADAGVDAVKFQTYKTEHFVHQSDTTRFRRLKSFELREQEFADLAELARRLGLMFISTPLDLLSAEFLNGIVDAFKIASGDNTFTPLIHRVAQFKKPLLIATGVSCSDDVRRLFRLVAEVWTSDDIRKRLGLLHCVSSYPTPAEDANLRAIEYLSQNYPCTIGYSDHTLGIHAASLAVALGARVIEKHFTLDKQYSDFRDHQLSADPNEMRQLVENVKLAARMLGDSAKSIRPSEEACRTAIRRSIVMSRDAAAGHRLSVSDFTWLRPGGGLLPGNEHLLVGRTLTRPLQCGDQISLADVA